MHVLLDKDSIKFTVIKEFDFRVTTIIMIIAKDTFKKMKPKMLI